MKLFQSILKQKSNENPDDCFTFPSRRNQITRMADMQATLQDAQGEKKLNMNIEKAKLEQCNMHPGKPDRC